MAGYKLSQYYRNQFWKIMQLINSEYIVKIEQVKVKEFMVIRFQMSLDILCE